MLHLTELCCTHWALLHHVEPMAPLWASLPQLSYSASYLARLYLTELYNTLTKLPTVPFCNFLIARLFGTGIRIPQSGARMLRNEWDAGVGSPLAGFPPNKEILFFDDFSEVTWLLAFLLTDIFSSWNCGFFDLSFQVMAILCCVAKNSLRSTHIYT